MEFIKKISIFLDGDIHIPTPKVFKKIKIQEYPFIVLKVTPYKTSYTHSCFEKIMNTLSKYNKGFLERLEFNKETKEIIYHPNQSLCYEMLFTKDKISFFYVIPEIYKSIFINKIKYLLPDCDVSVEDDYIYEFKESTKQTYVLSKSWMFGLNTNEKLNLSDNLLILNKDLLGNNDKLLIQYLFNPLQEYKWKNKWQNYYNKYINTGIVNGSFNILDSLDLFVDFILGQIDMIINSIMMAIAGEEPIVNEENKNKLINELSNDTKHKVIYDGFRTNINLYIKTDNSIVKNNVLRNTGIIMKDIESDNSIKAGKAKFIKTSPTRKINKASSIILNTKECLQFIKTPSEEKMQEFDDVIDKINVKEIESPKELYDSDGILLGEVKRGNIYRQISFGNHLDSLSKPLIYLSPQEGGKSSFLRNYGIGALEQGHSIFAFDTIDGKTTRIIRDYLSKNFPEEKIIVLDFKSIKYAFPLLWNEISEIYLEKLKLARDKYERYQILEDFGSSIGKELERFVDIFQADDKGNRLTAAMRSTLSELTQLVYMNGGNFGMIKDCIWDSELRHRLLEQLDIPKNLPFAKNILRLDDEKMYTTTLRGIETRLDLILGNATLKKYFSLQSDKKLDFTKWANEGYCVLIQLPEELADVLVTFLVQKLWLAVKSSRYDMPEEDRPMTHLLIDEPNRFPTVMDLLKDHIIASRKWRLRFIFCIHSIDIFGRMINNLMSAGVSVIMLPTDGSNFYRVEKLYAPYDYGCLQEVEKLIAKCNGKFRYAAVSLHYRSVNYPMIVKLPLPVENRYRPFNREYINDLCGEKYGITQREYYENLFDECGENGGIDSDCVAI